MTAIRIKGTPAADGTDDVVYDGKANEADVKPRVALSDEEISKLAGEAYRLCGYRSVKFNDGSIGVLGCPAKTIWLMNTFQALLMKASEG